MCVTSRSRCFETRASEGVVLSRRCSRRCRATYLQSTDRRPSPAIRNDAAINSPQFDRHAERDGGGSVFEGHEDRHRSVSKTRSAFHDLQLLGHRRDPDIFERLTEASRARPRGTRSEIFNHPATVSKHCPHCASPYRCLSTVLWLCSAKCGAIHPSYGERCMR